VIIAWIIGLALGGLLLIGFELFVPGMVLGFLGGIALIGCALLTFVNFGLMPGLGVVCILSLISLFGFMAWMRVFPRTYVGRKLSLDASVRGGNDIPDFTAWIGKTGCSATSLRPSGVALIEGKRLDVVTDGEFIENGMPVRVARAEGARVIVRAA